MALKIPEREAARICFKYVARNNGDIYGANNFLREVLGANHDQASKIVTAISMFSSEDQVDAFKWNDREEGNVSFSQSGSDKVLNFAMKSDMLPISTLEELIDYFEIPTDLYIPYKPVFNFWGSKDNPNFQVKAQFIRNELRYNIAEDREALRADMASYNTREIEVVAPNQDGDRLLELFITDAHFDRWADGYDLEEANQRFRMTVLSSVFHADYHGIDRILLVLNGDTFNADHKGATTKGTLQNQSETQGVSFTFVRQCICHAIEDLRSHYGVEVDVEILPGNHDKETAYALADSVWAYFNHDGGVHVNVTEDTRRYYEWGRVLLGFAHGEENAKHLPMWMMRENDVDDIDVFEWHLGHFHTLKTLPVEEVNGMLIRYFRSQAPSSQWEKERFVGNIQENRALLWDKDQGLVAEFPMQFFREG